MNNYKIKVNNESESREAQELFFELGYGFDGGLNREILKLEYNGGHYFFAYKDDLDLTHTIDSCIFNNKLSHREITLPQLRDIVVLKRNKIEDATHIRCDGKKYLHAKSTDCYYQFSDDGEWLLSTWMNYQLLPQLKPISEQKMASHNIEQQAEQYAQEMEKLVKPCLYLDPTQNYVEIEWDGSFMKQDHWIKVSDYANYLYVSACGKETWTINPRNSYGQLVWQRTQDEPFLTPESVVQREVHSKNVVEKANEFSERLKKLEYQVGTMESRLDLEPQDEAQPGAIKSDGGSTGYYKKEIPALVLERWKKTGIIEAEDVIRLFLGNDFTQGNNFKAGVRLISAQQGKGKAGLDPMYDHNKQEWFAASAKKAFIEFD